MITNGYVCAPYMHSHESIALKDKWVQSGNIESVYFATASLSSDSKPYFSDSSNHYLLARFYDPASMKSEYEQIRPEKTTFLFSIDDELFQRDLEGKLSLVSIYYLEYGESVDDMRDIATVLAKRDRVGKAGLGQMDIYSDNPPKFAFPYSKNIVILEVSSEKSHQSMNTYCEKTRKDITRKGYTMTNLMNISLLEKLK